MATKTSFRSAWRYRRCLLPANGFFEKGMHIKRMDHKPFWLAGLWNRWLGPDGSEIESCTVITTKANQLIKPFHNRMPVIISTELGNDWVQQKDGLGLRDLEPLLCEWSPDNWVAERIVKENSNTQMSIF
ncbi:SOS response-associated peptidase [Prochlorococcus sp. MIT 1307]|uniref:SOS response-associated peptidase n=1 Tax=Prochlorococcus sp. MIT 1307 TaxID=3096219 RepID=UPI002A75BEC4|nr:SOS response-associated peptidase family protein [Prochlorococcus sp. MIT 1307]